MKKPISIKLSERLWVYIKDKPNKSRYIEELIKQDVQQAQVKPIVQSVMRELLSNESFFREMSERLTKPTTQEMIFPTQLMDPLLDKLEQPFVPKPPDPATGYPCCQKQVPCKHWSFNGADDLWINILTGETKDA